MIPDLLSLIEARKRRMGVCGMAVFQVHRLDSKSFVARFVAVSVMKLAKEADEIFLSQHEKPEK